MADCSTRSSAFPCAIAAWQQSCLLKSPQSRKTFNFCCRWRKLEGSDPSTYEMIQKIQTLQKRLISKTEEVVEKVTRSGFLILPC